MLYAIHYIYYILHTTYYIIYNIYYTLHIHTHIRIEIEKPAQIEPAFQVPLPVRRFSPKKERSEGAQPTKPGEGPPVPRAGRTQKRLSEPTTVPRRRSVGPTLGPDRWVRPLRHARAGGGSPPCKQKNKYMFVECRAPGLRSFPARNAGLSPSASSRRPSVGGVGGSRPPNTCLSTARLQPGGGFSPRVVSARSH